MAAVQTKVMIACPVCEAITPYSRDEQRLTTVTLPNGVETHAGKFFCPELHYTKGDGPYARPCGGCSQWWEGIELQFVEVRWF